MKLFRKELQRLKAEACARFGRAAGHMERAWDRKALCEK